ncbi:hypothetical protein C1H46_011834 [Malus baccata]|uniref:Uncharacterized protein n=1 Tax=Malus baccata TaxID=106549 RepID=A0A540MUR5_MALBA|nr:hypothetical protein C1H46_011834 [Malus baccata]
MSAGMQSQFWDFGRDGIATTVKCGSKWRQGCGYGAKAAQWWVDEFTGMVGRCKLWTELIRFRCNGDGKYNAEHKRRVYQI